MDEMERLSDSELASLSPAKQSALRFIYEKQNIEKEKKEADSQLQKIKREKSISDKKLANAKNVLKKYENNESIILALAGIPSTADDRPNRIHAIETLFELLNLLGNGKVGFEKKLPFSALYNQVKPIMLLFDYVKQSASYNAETKKIEIDGRTLYSLVMTRIAEQKRLIANAEAVFAELEKDYKNDNF